VLTIASLDVIFVFFGGSFAASLGFWNLFFTVSLDLQAGAYFYFL